MSLDNHAGLQTEIPWAAFKNYVCAPYDNNSSLRASMEKWVDALQDRKKGGENLDLSHHTITHQNGYSFKAFALNEQMFFSHDPAVLTLPRGRDPANPDDRSDRLIGVLLHDSSHEDQAWRPIHQNGLEDIDAGRGAQKYKGAVAAQPYRDPVIDEHISNLAARGLLEGGERKNLVSEIRVARTEPQGAGLHSDCGPISLSPSATEPCWNRVFIHGLKNSSTTYAIDKNLDNKSKSKAEVPLPAGMITSHIQALLSEGDWKKMIDGNPHLKQGAVHRAVGDEDGRTVVIVYDKNTPSNTTVASPWTIKVSGYCQGIFAENKKTKIYKTTLSRAAFPLAEKQPAAEPHAYNLPLADGVNINREIHRKNPAPTI
ncbi:MAG: hypothetical protein WDO70_10605 [Alphaproteobacteria bacterium]